MDGQRYANYAVGGTLGDQLKKRENERQGMVENAIEKPINEISRRKIYIALFFMV